MKSVNRLGKCINVSRWLLILPGAVFASWLAFFILEFIFRLFSYLNGENPNSPLNFSYRLTITHLIMGYVFVHIGTWIAPLKQKTPSTLGLAALGLIFIGFLLFPAIYIINLSAIWGCLAFILGIFLSTYKLVNDECSA